MDLEEARKRKIEELQKRQAEEQQRQAEAEAAADAAVRGMLSEEARLRLGNVRLVNQRLYLKALQALLYLRSSGKLSGKVSEQEIVLLLDRLREKKDISIRRK